MSFQPTNRGTGELKTFWSVRQTSPTGGHSHLGQAFYVKAEAQAVCDKFTAEHASIAPEWRSTFDLIEGKADYYLQRLHGVA
nr:hypothetical protein 38 [bacterium]